MRSEIKIENEQQYQALKDWVDRFEVAMIALEQGVAVIATVTGEPPPPPMFRMRHARLEILGIRRALDAFVARTKEQG